MPIDEARMVSMFLKIGVAILFFHMANLVKSRNSNYILNRMISTSFVLYGFYCLLDAFVYNIVSLSATWYVIGQIIFAIAFLLLFAFVFFQLNAAKIIRFGSAVMQKKWRLVFEVVSLVVSIIIFIIYSGVDVYIYPDTLLSPQNLPPEGNFYIRERLSLMAKIAALVPVILYIHTLAILLFGILKSQNKALIKRMLFMFLGLCLIPMGTLYFYIRNNILGNYQIWTGVVGYIFTYSAAILIHYSVPKALSNKQKRGRSKNKKDT